MTDVQTTAAVYATVGLLSADEMSSVLKVSTQTLATWRCKKRGPPSIKLGKKVFYLLDDFSNWMQDEVVRQRGKQSVNKPFEYTPRAHPERYRDQHPDDAA